MKDIKCGMDVGLESPNSKRMAALGTIQKTDSKSKASDGYPLADCVEVLDSVVFNQTTILPRAHGKIQNLVNATARCIAWPKKNVCSVRLSGTVEQKRSTSKSEVSKFNNAQGASQTMSENKLARRCLKKKHLDVSTFKSKFLTLFVWPSLIIIDAYYSCYLDLVLQIHGVFVHYVTHPSILFQAGSMNQVRTTGRQGTSIEYRVKV